MFSNAEVYLAKAENDFWLSAEIAAKAPKEAQEFFQAAQAISAPYIKAGKWHTFSSSDEIRGRNQDCFSSRAYARTYRL